MGGEPATASSQGGSRGQAREETAADGSFSLVIAAEASTRFRVQAGSGALAVTRKDVLAIPASATLRLAVSDRQSGAPLTSYEIYWRAAGAGGWGRVHPPGGMLPDPSGCVDLELPRGGLELAVSARAQGYVSEERALQVRALPEPEVVEIGLARGTRVSLAFEIAREIEPGSLRDTHAFYLLGPGQVPPNEHSDGFHDREITRFQLVTPDEQGRGHASGLAPGRYRLVSRPEGFAFEPAELEVPALDQAHFQVRVIGAAPPDDGSAKKPKGMGYLGY
jgi:hypothetical protein